MKVLSLELRGKLGPKLQSSSRLHWVIQEYTFTKLNQLILLEINQGEMEIKIKI